MIKLTASLLIVQRMAAHVSASLPPLTPPANNDLDRVRASLTAAGDCIDFFKANRNMEDWIITQQTAFSAVRDTTNTTNAEACEDGSLSFVLDVIAAPSCGGFLTGCTDPAEKIASVRLGCKYNSPDQVVSVTCDSLQCSDDDGCSADRWCRDTPFTYADTNNPLLSGPILDQTWKECALYKTEGELCHQFLPTLEQRCAPSLACQPQEQPSDQPDDVTIPDLPSMCVDPTDTSAAAGQCSVDGDCSSQEWCRQTDGIGAAKECVAYASQGEECDGNIVPWLRNQCHPLLKCEQQPNDAPDMAGKCVPFISIPDDPDAKYQELAANALQECVELYTDLVPDADDSGTSSVLDNNDDVDMTALAKIMRFDISASKCEAGAALTHSAQVGVIARATELQIGIAEIGCDGQVASSECFLREDSGDNGDQDGNEDEVGDTPSESDPLPGDQSNKGDDEVAGNRSNNNDSDGIVIGLSVVIGVLFVGFVVALVAYCSRRNGRSGADSAAVAKGETKLEAVTKITTNNEDVSQDEEKDVADGDDIEEGGAK